VRMSSKLPRRSNKPPMDRRIAFSISVLYLLTVGQFRICPAEFFEEILI
jgi:hypothetical protein